METLPQLTLAVSWQAFESNVKDSCGGFVFFSFCFFTPVNEFRLSLAVVLARILIYTHLNNRGFFVCYLLFERGARSPFRLGVPNLGIAF